MFKKPETFLLFVLILLTSLMATGQQAVETDNEKVKAEEHGLNKAYVADELPALESSVPNTAADELVSLSGNTLMTAGTCLVIDDLVRQFCSANPGDISCQHQ